MATLINYKKLLGYFCLPFGWPILHFILSFMSQRIQGPDFNESILEIILGYAISCVVYLYRIEEKLDKEILYGDQVVILDKLPDISEKMENAKQRIWILTSWLPSSEMWIESIKENKNTYDLKLFVCTKQILKMRKDEVGDRRSEDALFESNVSLHEDFPDEVKFLSVAAHKLLFIIDDDVYFCPFLYKKQAVKSPCLTMKTSTTLGISLVEEMKKISEETNLVANVL